MAERSSGGNGPHVDTRDDDLVRLKAKMKDQGQLEGFVDPAEIKKIEEDLDYEEKMDELSVRWDLIEAKIQEVHTFLSERLGKVSERQVAKQALVMVEELADFTADDE